MHSLAAEKKNSEGKEDRRINGIRRGEREKKEKRKDRMREKGEERLAQPKEPRVSLP
jgi:hypothetical protein